MLDVVLYGYDHFGLLTLRERTFRSLRELARHFLSTDDGTHWQWAEVEVLEVSGGTRVIKYTPDRLLELVSDPGRTASLERFRQANNTFRVAPGRLPEGRPKNERRGAILEEPCRR